MRNPGCGSGMAIAGFDMFEVARDLGTSGIGKGSAEAVALRQGRAGPATKANLDNLENRMQETLYRALWIQTGVIVGTVVAKPAMEIALGFAGHLRRRRRRLERFSRAIMRTAGRGQALRRVDGAVMFDGGEGASLGARTMARLTVRKVSDEMVRALRRRVAARGRSAEAGSRNIPNTALFGAEENFAARAEARRRLRASVDSVETIRADRDRSGVAA